MSMTSDEMVAVIQANKAGKKIQAKAHCGEKDYELGWVDVCPNWDFYRCDFRVKPEPRELWVLKSSYDCVHFGWAFPTKESAENARNSNTEGVPIRVREVLQ
jgi:hypothetical protein